MLWGAPATRVAMVLELAVMSVAVITAQGLPPGPLSSANSQVSSDGKGIAGTGTKLRLPTIIGDHAMLQAGKPVPIWGWAEPGANIQVKFQNDQSDQPKFTDTADAHGHWSGTLSSIKTGTTGDLVITTDKGERTVVHDLLIGEVWLCSGQSNMQYDIAGTGRTDLTNAAEVAEVAANVASAKSEAQAATPPIRFFTVLPRRAGQPIDDVQGKWMLADAENVAHVSAVSWNFAVALKSKTRAPVGLIISSVGNTPIETWMSRETLESTSFGEGVFERSKRELAAATPEKLASYKARQAVWEAANPTPQLQAQNASAKPVAPPNLAASNYVPTQYYNGMIRGLEPYAIRGIVWYQGAGNFMHPFEYSELFLAMIKEWRVDWSDSDLPFLFVEESNFGPKQTEPVEPNPFSLIREQQHAALTLPGVEMICSADLGNGNPHYPNKRATGNRLANLALHYVYGEHGAVDSPLYQGFDIRGSRIELHFENAQGLHVRGGGDLKGFAIRGTDGNWVWASGRIQSERIILWSNHIAAPVAARYAWAQNPITSVENGVGLPLCPFRTDIHEK